jgi:hypothetical protein
LARRIVTTLVAAIVPGATGLACLLWAALADLRWFEHHALMAYCNTSPHISAWTTSVRVVVALLGVFFVAWVAPRGGRWAARRTNAQLVGSVLIVLVPVILALVTTELIIRRSGLAAAPSLASLVPEVHIDEQGWIVSTPSSSKEVSAHGRLVRYFIDARGDRAPDNHTQPDRQAPTILIAGESIAFGYDLPYELSCAALIADALGVQVVNVAGVGFGNDQAYERLASALAWFEHPIATVTFVVPEEMHRNVRNSSSRLAWSDGALQMIPPPRAWYTKSVLWRVLDRVLPLHTAESIELTHAILRETVRITEAHGARAFFVMTNYGPACLADAEGTPPLARELFRDTGGQHVIVDIREDEYAGDTDKHPNEAGERRLTAAILSAISSTVSPGTQHQ